MMTKRMNCYIVLHCNAHNNPTEIDDYSNESDMDTISDSSQEKNKNDESLSCQTIMEQIEKDNVTQENDAIDDNILEQGIYCNSLIDVSHLNTYLSENMVCNKCAKKRLRNKFLLKQETYGMATNLHFRCESMNIKHNFTVYAAGGGPNKKNIDSYSINVMALILSYFSGIGIRGLERICGFLGILSSFGNMQKWNNLMDKLGINLVTLANKCCAENRKIEVEKTMAIEGEECQMTVEQKKDNRLKINKKATGITVSLDM